MDPTKIVSQLEAEINWDDDDLINDEIDVFNTETESQDETEGMVY